MILRVNNDYFLDHLIFVMEKRSILFAVGTELLNIIHTSFGFKGSKKLCTITSLFVVLYTDLQSYSKQQICFTVGTDTGLRFCVLC
jgi:hypothetical protein